MRFLIITGVFIIALNNHTALSCSCFGPNTFYESVTQYTYEVELIGTATIYMGGSTRPVPYDINKVKLIQSYGRPAEQDTIAILVDKGFECFKKLKVIDGSDRYIITGGFDKVLVADDSTSIYEERDIFFLSLCSEPQVMIGADGAVYGNLTKNRRSEHNTKASRLSQREKQKRAERIWDRINAIEPTGLMQKTGRAKLDRKLKAIIAGRYGNK
jgi:hypothetical protein